MKKLLFFFMFLVLCQTLMGQKRQEVEINYTFNRYALVPLPENAQTYSIRTEWKSNSYIGSKVYAGEIVTSPLNGNVLLEGKYVNREADYETQYLSLPNLQRVESGGNIEVHLFIDFFKVNMKTSGKPVGKRSNGSNTYNYVYEYYLPCTLWIKKANGEVILEEIISHPNDLQRENYTEGDYFYGSNAVADMDTYAQLLTQISKRIYKKSFAAIQENVLRKDITLKFDIVSFTDKNHDYSDLTTAQQNLKTAIEALPTANAEAQEKVKEVAAIYEKVLTEYSADKKARINDKVKEELHFNLGLAYYFVQDFEKAKTALKNFVKIKEPEVEKDKFAKKQKRSIFSGSVDGKMKSFFEEAFDKKEKTTQKIKSHQDLYDLILDTEFRHIANGLVK